MARSTLQDTTRRFEFPGIQNGRRVVFVAKVAIYSRLHRAERVRLVLPPISPCNFSEKYLKNLVQLTRGNNLQYLRCTLRYSPVSIASEPFLCWFFRICILGQVFVFLTAAVLFIEKEKRSLDLCVKSAVSISGAGATSIFDFLVAITRRRLILVLFVYKSETITLLLMTSRVSIPFKDLMTSDQKTIKRG